MGGVCVRTTEDEFGPPTVTRGALSGRGKGSSARAIGNEIYWGADSPMHVMLHIYDVGTSGSATKLNGILRPLGTGVFHCGVEVFGSEWSYSDTLFGGDAIFCCMPRCCPGHTYIESIPMGRTSMSEIQFLDLIHRLKKEWTSARYDILKRNCCHFSDYLCQRLGVGSIPEWSKSLADTGAAILDTSGKCTEAAKEVLGQALAAATAANTLCCSSRADADLVEIVDVCKCGPEDQKPSAPKNWSKSKLSL